MIIHFRFCIKNVYFNLIILFYYMYVFKIRLNYLIKQQSGTILSITICICVLIIKIVCLIVLSKIYNKLNKKFNQLVSKKFLSNDYNLYTNHK